MKRIILMIIIGLFLIQSVLGQDSDCIPNDHRGCYQGGAYWIDSCNVQGDLIEECHNRQCEDGICIGDDESCYPLVSTDADSARIEIQGSVQRLNVLNVNILNNNIYYEVYNEDSDIRNPPIWSQAAPSELTGPCYSVGKDYCTKLQRVYEDDDWKYAVLLDTCGDETDLRIKKEIISTSPLSKLYKISDNIAGFDNGEEVIQIVLKEMPLVDIPAGATKALFKIISSSGFDEVWVNKNDCIIGSGGACNVKLTSVWVYSPYKQVTLTKVEGIDEMETKSINIQIPRASPLKKISNYGAEAGTGENDIITFLLKDSNPDSNEVLIENFYNDKNLGTKWLSESSCLSWTAENCRIGIKDIDFKYDTIYLTLRDDSFDEEVFLKIQIIKPTEETGPIETPKSRIKEEPSEIEERSVQELPFICSGCQLESKCFPFGYRKEGKFCSENEDFMSQLEANSICENNFECKTNSCLDNQCTEPGFWQKIFKWLSRLFG